MEWFRGRGRRLDDPFDEISQSILVNAFSFEAAGAKEKAWRKENAVSVGSAPTPRSLFWKKARQKTKLGCAKFRDRFPLDAFFFGTKGTKKKALQKRNAASVGSAPTPRSLFWKKARQKTKLQKRKRRFCGLLAHTSGAF